MTTMTTAVRHETRALLRAHLAAATGYRHLTRHCPICHQLLRLAMEPRGGGPPGPRARRAPPPRHTGDPRPPGPPRAGGGPPDARGPGDVRGRGG
ncbi:DUF6274 family protein, partial [Streptomyces celluloflavus]